MKKTIQVLVFILFFSLLLMGSSSEYFGWDWNEGIQKNTDDPLYMQMPSSIHAMVPTTVKIYINDPLVKEYANYAEVQAGNSYIYPLSGNRFGRNSGGNFRETIEYNGEDSIKFGFRPRDGVGMSSSITVTFYITKEHNGDGYPDTDSEDSEFFGYNCNFERNKLLCNKEDGCRICHHPIGQVTRYFMVSETQESISLPNRVDFVNEREENNYNGVGFQSLSYSSKKKFINTQDLEMESSDIYTIKLNTQQMWGTFEEFKENDLDGYTGQADNVNNPDVTVSDISVSGPELTGKAYEMVYTRPINPQHGGDFVDIYYQLFAEMNPVGSGVMIIKASRKTVFEKGTGSESELKAIRNDISGMLSSYKLSKGRVLEFETQEEYMIPKWYVKSEVEEEEMTDTYYVAGHMSDYFDHPLPYMLISAKIDGFSYEGITDEDGVYKIPLEGIELEEGEEKEVVIGTNFEYVRDNKNYFNVEFRKPDNQYTKVVAGKKGNLLYGEHLQIDFRMDDEYDSDYMSNLPNKKDLKHYSLIYFHTAEAVEFILKTLKEDLDYKLPVTIYVGNRDKNTWYSPSDSHILISADDASLSDSDRPDNREYHEFMHALMYDIYGAWPEGGRLQGTVNHNGFHNPSTADSYMEGFAEFMAMVVSDEMGEYSPEIYAGFGSLDQNYEMWDGRGFDEEFAVASLLWDMYDEYNEDGDELSMTIEDMWKVLKVKRKDFYEYYKAFKAEFPKKADAIDKVFILHGIYDDTREGNHKYDKGEPLRFEGQGNNRRGFYIDLSGNISKSPIEWEANLTIGKSADYARSWRSSAGRIPGSFLKITDDEVDFYKVVIISDKFNYEYIVDRKDELIYIKPLPQDINATITVVPFSKDYVAKDVFTIESEELNKRLFVGLDEKISEYFAEHEFNLEKTGSNEDDKYILYDDVKPTYAYEGDLGGEEDYEIKEAKEDEDFLNSLIDSGSKKESKNNSFGFFNFISLLIKLGLIVLFCVFGYFYFKKPEFKKKSNIFFKKAWEFTKKKYNEFIKYAKPRVLKISKWLWEKSVIAYNWILHNSKKVYHKAKPHVEKAHQSIKKKVKVIKNKKKHNNK